MPSRRKFLKNFAGASAGLCFVNCSLTRAFAGTSQSPAAGKRRQITVGGRRARTIDIHAHCYVDLHDLVDGHPEALIPNGGPPTFDGAFLSPTKDVDARLRHMDEHGIDIQAVSLAPAYNYWADRDLAGKDRLAPERTNRRIMRRSPGPFRGPRRAGLAASRYGRRANGARRKAIGIPRI